LNAGKVPQSKLYSLDFIHDSVNSAALDTANSRALEFNFDFTAGDVMSAIVECLDGAADRRRHQSRHRAAPAGRGAGRRAAAASLKWPTKR
jgi:hypothetical protein